MCVSAYRDSQAVHMFRLENEMEGISEFENTLNLFQDFLANEPYVI